MTKFAVIDKKTRIIRQLVDSEDQLPADTGTTESVEVDDDQKVGDKAREDDDDANDQAKQPA